MTRRLSCRVFLAAAVLFAAGIAGASEQDRSPVLSVLDFNNNSGGEDWKWLSAGLADMLITDLAGTDLVLVDRSDLEAIFDEQALALAGLSDDTALELGRLLQADALLTGSYTVIGNTMRMDFRIIDTTTGETRDAGSVSGPPAGVFELENSLVLEICRVMGVEAPELTAGPGTVSLPAARAYYDGVILQRSGAVEDARARFEEAADLDPLYARPRYSLEESWQLLKDFRMLRRQQEVNALWRKAETLESRLNADPFMSDSDAIMAAVAAGTPVEDIPGMGSCQTQATCLWNLQITYWEIGNLSSEYFGDEATEEAVLLEIIRLAGLAEEEWPGDDWLPEILYWEILAWRWLEEWEEVRSGCERIFVEWPTFRMGWALEDFYELALTELEKEY